MDWNLPKLSNIERIGKFCPTGVNVRLVDFGGQPRVIVYVRDLTDRRQNSGSWLKASFVTVL